MKILFIAQPYIIDPLGIGYLSSYVKQLGHTVELEHSVFDYAGYPDVVAFSVTTGTHQWYLGQARVAKKRWPTAPTVMGGPHPTYFDVDEEGIDHVVKGEGEVLFAQLLADIPQGRAKKVYQLNSLVGKLDSFPSPDRALINKKYNPIRNVMTSRGCPFSCPYCYNSVYKEMYDNPKVRYHSISRVIEECRDLKDNWGTKFIFFTDDEFALSENRLREFATRYHKLLPYHCQMRIELLTPEKARLLADSGCRSVTFAVESGSESYRRMFLNRNMSNDQVVNGAKMLREAGISYRIENMLALPYETLQDAIKTLDLNIECKPTLGWASLYQPYPGTELGDLATKGGLWDGSVNSIKPSFFEDSVLNIKYKKQFVNLQRLFGLIVSFPSLRRFLPLLLGVPNNRLYDWIFKWWKNRKYDKELYVWK